MTKKFFLQACAGIFGLVALAHLTRAVAGWQWTVGPWTVPLWVSWVAAAGAGAMALWAWRLNKS